MLALFALISAIFRTNHHVLRATASTMDKPTNRTLIRLQFEDKPDSIFQIEGFLEGEALHSRLDLLIDEHHDASFVPFIEVVAIDQEGKYHEDGIPITVY